MKFLSAAARRITWQRYAMVFAYGEQFGDFVRPRRGAQLRLGKGYAMNLFYGEQSGKTRHNFFNNLY